MPATEKMHTENTESSFSVFSVCILPWPALSVVASNFGIEAKRFSASYFRDSPRIPRFATAKALFQMLFVLRHAGLAFQRQVRNNPQKSLDHHQLPSVVHFMLLH